MATVHWQWGRIMFIWVAAFALTLFVASACDDVTGPPNTPLPDDTTGTANPKDPQGQGFLLQSPGSQGLLV
jgi:hypothetical protein